MPDGEDRPDAYLIALARALGRYQAHLDMARGGAGAGARTNDYNDPTEVVLTRGRVFDGSGIDVRGSCESKNAARQDAVSVGHRIGINERINSK